MAHYAFLNEENTVVEVITGIDETILIEGLDPETWYGNYRGQKCIRTSYNNNIRKRFAGIGMSYREDLDAFIYPQCHQEATFEEESLEWKCLSDDHSIPVS